MKCWATKGLTLVELLVAMAVASIVGTMLMQLFISFSGKVLAEISRNDLQDRAERLVRFMTNDISHSAFLLGALPNVANDAELVLVHDSLPGDPPERFPFAIIARDVSGGHDQLTFLKAESFSPPLSLVQHGVVGEDTVVLNRRPNRSPGSTREIHPAPEAINHLVFDNHRLCYSADRVDLSLQLSQPLEQNVPVKTEVLGVRAYSYSLDPFAGSNRLRRDDFTSRNILDNAVDGLQFQYLMKDGSMVDQPLSPADIRGVKVGLLVRDLRPDRNYSDNQVYLLGNQTYGPFRDHFRRCTVSYVVEVKNHGLP